MICKPLHATVRAFFTLVLSAVFFSAAAQAALVPVNRISVQSLEKVADAPAASAAQNAAPLALTASNKAEASSQPPGVKLSSTPSLALADSGLPNLGNDTRRSASLAQRLGEVSADMQQQAEVGAEQMAKTVAGWQQKGVASWYGPGFHGRKTASGERFNTHELTAAHLTLPFGTKLLVRNERNGKEVIVRVNDRGPYAKSRVIDLSQAAARALGIDGIGRVIIERLEGNEGLRKTHRRAD